MTLNTFSSGVNTSFSTELNQNFNAIFTQAGLNQIRQQIDRAITFSAGEIEGWCEAYIDSNGRGNSVTTTVTSTSAQYDNGNASYHPKFMFYDKNDSVDNSSSFTTPYSAFDEDASTNAYLGGATTTSAETVYFDVTFGATTIGDIRIDCVISANTTLTNGADIILQTYNGSVWADEATLNSVGSGSASYDSTYSLNSSVQGVRLKLVKNATAGSGQGQYTVSLFYETTHTQIESIITHTIPSGTFSATITEAIGVPFIDNWETGANIQYKLTGTGGAEDTGWLSCGVTPTISTFTAFTAEPDTLLVKLIPKTTSPTNDYPSIKGFYVRAS